VENLTMFCGESRLTRSDALEPGQVCCWLPPKPREWRAQKAGTSPADAGVSLSPMFSWLP